MTISTCRYFRLSTFDFRLMLSPPSPSWFRCGSVGNQHQKLILLFFQWGLSPLICGSSMIEEPAVGEGERPG